MADKLIITAALTGAITIPTQTKNLPYSTEAIIADAVACAQAGAANVHIHARNSETGQPSSEPDLFEPILRGIKQSGTNVIIGTTTGGGMGMLPVDRLRVVPRLNLNWHPSI